MRDFIRWILWLYCLACAAAAVYLAQQQPEELEPFTKTVDVVAVYSRMPVPFRDVYVNGTFVGDYPIHITGKVFLDGEQVGQTPMRLMLHEGEYRLKVQTTYRFSDGEGIVGSNHTQDIRTIRVAPGGSDYEVVLIDYGLRGH